jgi:cytochrome c-type biogenesis protein CcmH/NrfF
MGKAKTIYWVFKPVLVVVGVAILWLATRRRAY